HVRELRKKIDEVEKKKPGANLFDESVALGLVLLKDKNYDEAERFYKSLGSEPIKNAPFASLSKLGQATGLAFRGKPTESNRMFQSVIEPENKSQPLVEKKGQRSSWRGHIGMREMVARALNYNMLADPEHFPKSLEPFLHPPAPTLRPARVD